MTKVVFDSIMKIRESGKVNMFEIVSVQNLAYRMRLFELVEWLNNHKREYIEFILTGKHEHI